MRQGCCVILVVNLVERITPMAGNEMTFLEQIFGNVGRFSDKTKPGKM
ncbi:MAG: hypothetical protein HQL45_11095 [Alphaproteobacteria bacterium]|nr:hypothetical protein [Alphaproteobacteria bacterium]